MSKLGSKLIAVASILCFLAPAHGLAEAFSAEPVDDILYYQRRYTLPNLNEKLVDNKGQGFEDLYGTRNFRVVLDGVLYRGGANNKYNKFGVRDNRNPLPAVGLGNLCREGFSKVYYMYSTNYVKKQSVVQCSSDRAATPSEKHLLDYKQLGPWDSKTQYALLKVVFDSIQNPLSGPVYFHCWNGWHASGLISALALRQFCGFTGDDAVEYWDKNTDGNNTDKAYDSYRQKIRTFVPFEDLKVSSELQRVLCRSSR